MNEILPFQYKKNEVIFIDWFKRYDIDMSNFALSHHQLKLSIFLP